MSKGTAVVLPAILLVLDCWPFRRVDLSCNKSNLRTLLKLVLEKLPFFALSLAVGVLTMVTGKHLGFLFAGMQLSLPERVHNALLSLVAYLRQTVWPTGLAVFYPYARSFPVWPAVRAALLLGTITVLVVRARRTRPYLAAGWFCFGIAMLPMLGMVQLNAIARADRYAYFALAGLFVMAVWGLADLGTRWSRLSGAWIAAALLALAGYALVSARQLAHWRNSETLFRHALAVTQDNHVAHDNLGLYLWEHGNADEAIEHYRASLAIHERFEPLHNLALALARQGRTAEAIPLYQAALALRPGEVAARANLVEALASIGRWDEAAAQCQMVLRTRPDDLAARNNLGIILTMQGKLDESVAQFREVLRTDPPNPSAHGNLAYALALQHKPEEAADHYRAVLRSSPDDVRAHQGLGNALAALGKLEEAIGQFDAALRLNPDSPSLHCQLGMAFESQGQRERAIAQYTEALRLKPDYAEARRQLDALTGPGKR